MPDLSEDDLSDRELAVLVYLQAQAKLREMLPGMARTTEEYARRRLAALQAAQEEIAGQATSWLPPDPDAAATGA